MDTPRYSPDLILSLATTCDLSIDEATAELLAQALAEQLAAVRRAPLLAMTEPEYEPEITFDPRWE